MVVRRVERVVVMVSISGRWGHLVIVFRLVVVMVVMLVIVHGWIFQVAGDAVVVVEARGHF